MASFSKYFYGSAELNTFFYKGKRTKHKFKLLLENIIDNQKELGFEYFLFGKQPGCETFLYADKCFDSELVELNVTAECVKKVNMKKKRLGARIAKKVIVGKVFVDKRAVEKRFV